MGKRGYASSHERRHRFTNIKTDPILCSLWIENVSNKFLEILDSDYTHKIIFALFHIQNKVCYIFSIVL